MVKYNIWLWFILKYQKFVTKDHFNLPNVTNFVP